MFLKKDEPDVPVVLHGIFKVAFHNYFFTPTSEFQLDKTPPSPLISPHFAFANTEASVVLHPADTTSDPAKEWKSYTNNLTTLESLLTTQTSSGGSVVINNGAGIKLTTRFIVVSSPRHPGCSVVADKVKRRRGGEKACKG